jgi:hypothetical protein
MKRVLVVAGAAGLALAAWAAGGAAEPPVPVSEPWFQAELPATWRELPELADTAQQAAAARADDQRLRIETRAWGDPAAGCFAIAQHALMPSGGTSRDLHDALQRGLDDDDDDDGPALEIRDYSFEDLDARAESKMAFTLGPMQGTSRVVSTRDASGMVRAVAASCFYNDREPERSANRCERLLSTFVATP